MSDTKKCLCKGYNDSCPEKCNTYPCGTCSHAEGYRTLAEGNASHAEGCCSKAIGHCSHAEGLSTEATGNNSHTEGEGTIAQGKSQTVIGEYNEPQGTEDTHNNTDNAFIIGNGTDDGTRSNALEVNWNGDLKAYGEIEDGYGNKLSNACTLKNLVDGNNTGAVRGIYTKDDYTMGENAFAVGYDTTSKGNYSHAEGDTTIASGTNSHSKGYYTTASGENSCSEGYYTTASGFDAHAEGDYTISSGADSHAEGDHTTASGWTSHAEGYYSTANGSTSHVEGAVTTTLGSYSHAEGFLTKANGMSSHSEGSYTTAYGNDSHVQNFGGVAQGKSQTVIGEYNVVQGTVDTRTDTDYAFIIGNGTNSTNRSNALSVNWNGDALFNGHVTATGFTPDFAEMFETIDGNQIDVGYFVTLDGDKIRKANSKDEYILGITSATPAILADGGEMRWKYKYVTDEWGRVQYEEVIIKEQKLKEICKEHYEEIMENYKKLDIEYKEKMKEFENSENKLTEEKTEKYEQLKIKYEQKMKKFEDMKKEFEKVIIPKHTEWHPILNPEFDNTKEYIPRSQRPEWAAVGLTGKLLVRDDGTCKANGYCKPNDKGIATASDKGYRVMKRTRKNQILILVR